MSCMAVVQVAIGAVVGLVARRVLKFSPEDGRDVTLCSTFANSGPLPFIFVDALFGGTHVYPKVSAAISFYLLTWSPLFWSVGRMILGTYGSGSDPNASLWMKFRQQMRQFFSPPVIGSVAGLIIGAVPFFRDFCMKGIGKPFYSANQSLAPAYLPAALLVLAGSLVAKNDGVPEITPPSMKKILSIFSIRFAIAPVLTFGLWKALASLGILGPAGSSARAIVTFVILMEGCMPPAQNSVTMLQLDGLAERASGMAQLLTILYSLAVVPITILMSGCLEASGILQL